MLWAKNRPTFSEWRKKGGLKTNKSNTHETIKATFYCEAAKYAENKAYEEKGSNAERGENDWKRKKGQ